MGVKAEAKAKMKQAKAKAKRVRSQLRGGARALVGQDEADDEESLQQKQIDKAEGEESKQAKSGSGVPRVMISEPGRQAFWFIIIAISVVSCQAGLVLSFLGATLRPALEYHDVLMNHYGQIQATLNVGKSGSFVVIIGLMMVKGSAFQLVAALLARQKRKSRRRCAVKVAFGCILFEVAFIVLVVAAVTLMAVRLQEFHTAYEQTLPQALVDGYLRNVSITKYINWLQFRFQCCGVTDHLDWFIADWLPLQWLINRYPHIPHYRDMYASIPKVEQYSDWREMSRMVNYQKSAPSRLDYIRDRTHGKVGNKLVLQYLAVTGFAEVPFSCCRPDSPSTFCVRQYTVFHLYAYNLFVNGSIYVGRGCARRVRQYIDGRLHGVGSALLALLGVRLLNLLLLRLAQTSTFNALVARRHLSPAFGWLLTTVRPQPAPSADDERRNLLEQDLLTGSDEYEDEWDGIDDIDSELLLQLEDDISDTTDGDSGGNSDDDTSAGSEEDDVDTEVDENAADPSIALYGVAEAGTPESEEMTEVSSIPP